MNSLLTTKAMVLREIYTQEKPIAQSISRQLNINYGYTTNLISQLEAENLIRAEEDGRRKVLSVTDSGEWLAEDIDDIVSVCSGKLNDKSVAVPEEKEE